MDRRNCQKRRQRRGAVAVEMAVTLPLLLLVVFAALEFGRMNVIRHTVDNAAYEAARRAIVPGVTAGQVEQTARDIMDIVGAVGVNVQVTPAVINIDTPEINVNVSVAANQNGFIAPFFFNNRQLVGSVTMRREEL